LYAGWIWRFGCKRQVDGDDEEAAFSQRAIHRLFGETVFFVPRPAVQIENGGERSGAFRLINSRRQHPIGAVAPKLDFADGKIEPGGGIISGRASRMGGARPERARDGETGRARQHQREKVTSSESASVHVRLRHNDRVAERYPKLAGAAAALVAAHFAPQSPCPLYPRKRAA